MISFSGNAIPHGSSRIVWPMESFCLIVLIMVTIIILLLFEMMNLFYLFDSRPVHCIANPVQEERQFIG